MRILCAVEALARTPRAASCFEMSNAVMPVAETSKNKILVTTLAGSILIPGICASSSAKNRAFAWSMWSRLGLSSNATRPAAANTPAWRIPPPSILRTIRASSMNSLLLTSMDPTGAPSPFERQNMTESKFFVTSATGFPRATPALKTLAPSRCTGSPAACACSTMSFEIARG